MSIPPMPPGGPAWLCSSSFGASATMTSVVSSSPATEAAFCSASRVTLVGSRMPTTEGAPALLDAVENHRGVLAGVVDDLAQRLLDRARENADADRLVLIRRLELVEHLLHTDQRDATTGHHALFHRRTGRVQRVLDAGLLLLHLDLGGRADLDQGDTAGELRHALLQLLLVVIGGRLLDLLTDRLESRLDAGGLAV